MGDRKVAFFVDDDQDFLTILSHAIRHPLFDIRVYCATNGYQAIDEIIKVKPDVVFIDFNLPRANGGQVVPILKSINQFRNLPVYFVTGYPPDAVSSFLTHLEFAGLLQKNEHVAGDILQILDQLAGTAYQG